MRLVTFEVSTRLGPCFGIGQSRRLGLWRSSLILDVNLAYAALLAQHDEQVFAQRLANAVLPPDMLGFFQAGAKGQAALAEVAACWADDGFEPGSQPITFAETEVKLLAPVPRPNTLRDFSTFEQHQQRVTRAKGSAEVPEVWYQMPVYWKANPDNVIGPEAEVHWPSYSEQLDYELEFGVFIGRSGKNIRVAGAHEYIAGYTIFNDFSARDRQARETVMTFGPAKGKDFDTGKALGPCLVTPDEFGEGNHRMTAHINGELWSEGWTNDMYWSFADLIAYISQSETLRPGDFLGSGACGTGCGLELNRWLQPGDTVALTVDGIGTLRNRVVRDSPGASHATPK